MRKFTSKYKGVTKGQYLLKKRRFNWIATCRGKYLGLYPSERAAAIAYDEAAIQAFGKKADLNFPKGLK